MSSSAVVVGERSGWAPEERVEEHRERQGKQAWGDALHVSGDRLGELLIEAHIAFEVRQWNGPTPLHARTREVLRR